MIIVPIVAIFAINLGSVPAKSNYSFEYASPGTIVNSVSYSSKFEEFYDGLNPDMKEFYDNMASNVMTPDPKELYDTNYPEFKQIYDNFDDIDRHAYDNLPSKLQYEFVISPELLKVYFELDPESKRFFVTLGNINTKVLTCDISESSGVVKVDYSVTNNNPTTHNLTYDVLGLDWSGNVVSLGKTSIEVLPVDTSYNTVLIDDHPDLVDCDLKIDQENIN